MAQKRIRLAERRRTLGLSQEGLAERMHVDRSTVARWERGETDPQPLHRPRLAEALTVSIEQLAGLLADSSGHTGHDPDTEDEFGVASDPAPSRTHHPPSQDRLAVMSESKAAAAAPPSDSPLERQSNRREFLTGGTQLAAALTLNGHLSRLFADEAYEMQRALDAGSRSASLAEYESTADRLVVCYDHHGPGEVLGPALELFHTIRRLVERPQTLDARRRLARTASALAALLGNSAYDYGWQASGWYGVARRAAIESGDGTLLGWAIAQESLEDYYGGRERSALQSLLGARGLVDGGAVAAVIVARVARAHAALGESHEALTAFDEAERLLEGASDEQRQLYWFSWPQLAFYRTTCLRRLGRLDEVELAASEALRLYANQPTWIDPALVRLEAASAYLVRKPPELENAAVAARGALETLPAAHRIGPVRQRGAEIASAMGKYRKVPAAREFIDYIAHLRIC